MNIISSPPTSGRFAFCSRAALFPFAPGPRVTLALILASFAATAATAQQVTSSGGVVVSGYYGPPPTPQPLPPETQNSGPSLGPSGRPPSNDQLPGDWINRGYDGGHTRDYYSRRTPGPFFLPVLLPVLGAAPRVNSTSLSANYPREFAGEPFFMAYGNLAAHQELSAKRLERIARYRTARLALLTELREQLSRGPDASTLANLASAQTPRLLALEAEAEEIRHDLTHGEFFRNVADDIGRVAPNESDFTYENHQFNSGPFTLGYEVTVRPVPGFDAARADLRQILSAAHSQDGYSLEQRRLLEEMAQEIMLTIEPEPGPAAVFFWPAGARIRGPADLPPGEAAQFEDFQQRKSALKEELRAALKQGRAHWFNTDNTEEHARLAAAQAPRFAELDALADQIRPALAALAETTATLPADLGRQVATVVERKTALQRELYARLTEFRRELPKDRIELSRQSSGLAITIVTTNSSGQERESALARINAFNAEVSDRFTALATERDRVRDALARYQASVPGLQAGVTVDRLAADFLAAYQARESRNRQHDYVAAVFAPGLSSAQRRLLLAAAAADSVQNSSPPSAP